MRDPTMEINFPGSLAELTRAFREYEEALPTSSSSGIELTNCQVFLLGNSTEGDSPFAAGHHRLSDMIDTDGIHNALKNAGLKVSGSLDEGSRSRVLNVLGKTQVPLDGLVRGCRTTLLTDSDLNTRPRAVLGTLIASLVGDPAICASAGWAITKVHGWRRHRRSGEVD